VAPIATIDASAIRDALTKKPWRLTSVTDAAGLLPVPAAQHAGPTMKIDSYVADDGCNQLTGSAAYTDVKVSTGEPTSTHNPCPTVADRWRGHADLCGRLTTTQNGGGPSHQRGGGSSE
jgi:hypothetical protein